MKKKHHMPVVGLTGGIGMGKSTVAKILRSMRFPVYEADKAVHDLLKKGGKAVNPVTKLFPTTLSKGAIDRKALGHIVFHHPAKLKKLEAILHPLVHEAERAFIKKAEKKRTKAVILEIPLLFETNAYLRCDHTITVTAPKSVQQARVMQRPGMTAAKLKAILDRQMTDAKKRKIADFVVDTGGSIQDTKRQLVRILKLLGASS
jgi:dephospho-CoA kinase